MATETVIAIVAAGIAAAGFLLNIYTTIKISAKNQQALESRFDVVDVEIQHIKADQIKLSNRVEKHNGVMERTFQLEGSVRENSHDIMELKTDTREIKNKLMNMTRRQ